MYRQGRPVDSRFLPRHQLYFRCTKEDLIGPRLNPARIPYKNVSVNWSKYGKPWDVIFDYPDEGFVRFIVGELPKELPKDIPPVPKGSKKAKHLPDLHFFKPVHDPIEENYGHCEIATFRKGERIDLTSSLVKKEFRTAMSLGGLLLRWPRV